MKGFASQRYFVETVDVSDRVRRHSARQQHNFAPSQNPLGLYNTVVHTYVTYMIGIWPHSTTLSTALQLTEHVLFGVSLILDCHTTPQVVSYINIVDLLPLSSYSHFLSSFTINTL